jgi:hypothetical protein
MLHLLSLMLRMRRPWFVIDDDAQFLSKAFARRVARAITVRKVPE